jgi:hypothetical protein
VHAATDDNSGMTSAEEEEQDVYDIQTVAQTRNSPAEVERFDPIYEQPTKNEPEFQADVETTVPETDYDLPSGYMPSTVQHNDNRIPPAKAQKLENAVNTEKVSCVIVDC